MIPYQETPHDRLLAEKPFRVWMGAKIDVRWSGGWLTPHGEYLPIDYENGITHETIAEEYVHRTAFWHKGQDNLTVRMIDLVGWMRITYFEYSCFCVELTGSLVQRFHPRSEFFTCKPKPDKSRRDVLSHFVRDYSRFEEYFLNDDPFPSFKKFKAAIGNDSVHHRHIER